MYYIYILQSLINEELYVGSTNNLQSRFLQHNEGKVFSTKRYMPWRLIYYEAYMTEKFARLREHRLKHHGNAIRELKRRIGFDVKSGAGFTLIETLIYIAFFSLLVGSLLGITYQTLDNAGRINQKISIQQEGTFILRKIEWALTGATTISVVASPPSLTINKFNFNPNPIVFNLNSGAISLQRGALSPLNLNSQNVTVSNLVFTDIPQAGKKPEAVTVSFNLSNQTFTNQPFSITKYLRK